MTKAMRIAATGFLLSAIIPILTATADDSAAASRGAALLTPFKQDLKEALTAGMRAGPGDAITVCKVEAPAIAARLSIEGVAMGRTSHRLRNPANASPDWVTPVLQAYLDNSSDQEPRVVALEDRIGYVEPIRMQPLCLTCHGRSLAPEILSRIEADYPADEATGFDAGELRGVFWVTFPGEAN